MMKAVMIAAMAAGVSLATLSTANAEGGCGPAFHRNYWGYCRPNFAPGPVVYGAPVIGVYYGGRGYWDGYRYWGHRDAWRGGWRYR